MDEVTWGAFDDDQLAAYADAIARVARELARSVPPPRGAPLFGLDATLADPEILDRFSRHGIFRKYQRAVALGSELGGVARWWSVHFGCTVLAVDPHPGLLAAAERLAATAAIGRTSYRATPLDRLPLRAEQFTHAWSIDALAAAPAGAPVLAEALRVLRPAGLLTTILPGTSADDPAVRPWVEAVAAAGFIGVAVKPLPPREVPYAVFYAEHVLRGELETTFHGPIRDRLLALHGQLVRARASRAPQVMLFAERPS